MTPLDQTIMHDPENGQWGDCMRACVASLLDLPIDAVPHFFEGGSDVEFDRRLAEFLASHGLIEVKLLPAYGRHITRNQPCYHLIYGNTVRGTYHAVVGLSGKVAHDPHPSKAGIIEDGNLQHAFLIRTGTSTGATS